MRSLPCSPGHPLQLAFPPDVHCQVAGPEDLLDPADADHESQVKGVLFVPVLEGLTVGHAGL